MGTFEVVMKNGRLYLRHWHPIYDFKGGYEDRAIYGVKTQTPYIKWNWRKLELEDDMKEQLKKLLAV